MREGQVKCLFLFFMRQGTVLCLFFCGETGDKEPYLVSFMLLLFCALFFRNFKNVQNSIFNEFRFEISGIKIL